MHELRESLDAMILNFPNCTHLLFTTNHDENSWNGTEYEKYGSAALPLAVFSITWKGVPLIYSGQENPNHKRLNFFDKDLIEWTINPQLLQFYQTLLQLRRRHPAIDGDKNSTATFLETGAYDKAIAFVRSRDNRKVLVILNFSDDNIEIKLSDPIIEGNYREFSLNRKL